MGGTKRRRAVSRGQPRARFAAGAGDGVLGCIVRVGDNPPGSRLQSRHKASVWQRDLLAPRIKGVRGESIGWPYGITTWIEAPTEVAASRAKCGDAVMSLEWGVNEGQVSDVRGIDGSYMSIAAAQCQIESGCGADLGKVTAAVASPERFWTFITSPGTSYFDREAAIERGWRLLSPQWIPRLIRARNELLREWHLHQFGVSLSRWDAGGGRYPSDPRARIGTAINRTFLGYKFVVPARKIEYPETPAERAAAPWPFQVFYLIDGLYGSEGLYRRVVRNTTPTGLDQIVLSLPCEDYDSASALVNVTLIIAEKSHHVRSEIFATWLNALHNHNGSLRVERATLGIMAAAAKSIAAAKGDESWVNLQVLGVEAIETKDSTQTSPVIGAIRYLTPIPYTLVLSAARYLEQAKDLHSSWRAVQANALLDAVTPVMTDPASRRNTDSHSASKDEVAVATFLSWFSNNRAALEARAAGEAELIAAARQKLRRNIGACRH